MKKHFYIFIIIGLLLSSCGDEFLTIEPLTEKTDINYYSTPAEANEALVGCYDGLQLVWSGNGVAFPVASEVMSDLCFGGTGAGDGDGYPMMDQFDINVSPADLNMFEGNWINYYKGIYRCNVLISKINQVDWSKNETEKGPIEAEARFLRAFLYFDMVRMWERIPLITEPTVSNVPQSEPDETYKLIAEDLLFAVNNLPEKPYSALAATEYGHATKWAASALLARVYMFYTGYYGKSDLLGLVSKTEVLALLENVITNSGHDLIPKYSDLWPAAATSEASVLFNNINLNTYAGETNSEVVFAIKYTYTSDYNGNTDGNHWMVMNGLRNQSWAKRGYGNGWGGCTVPKELYTGWNTSDTRRNASIMAISEEAIKYNEIKDVKEYTGYFTKKYIPLCDTIGNSTAVNFGGVNFMIGQYQDYFSIRFADVLLMAAELGSPNALDYVNRVHTRAGLPALAAVDKDIIYEERRLEFAFEGIRYWDLLRYDNTLNYASSKVSYTGTVKTGGVDVPKTIDGANLVKTRGLFQIPNNQITLSGGVITQNIGWN